MNDIEKTLFSNSVHAAGEAITHLYVCRAVGVTESFVEVHASDGFRPIRFTNGHFLFVPFYLVPRLTLDFFRKNFSLKKSMQLRESAKLVMAIAGASTVAASLAGFEHPGDFFVEDGRLEYDKRNHELRKNATNVPKSMWDDMEGDALALAAHVLHENWSDVTLLRQLLVETGTVSWAGWCDAKGLSHDKKTLSKHWDISWEY